MPKQDKRGFQAIRSADVLKFFDKLFPRFVEWLGTCVVLLVVVGWVTKSANVCVPAFAHDTGLLHAFTFTPPSPCP